MSDKIPKNWKPFDKYRIIRADQSASDQSKHSQIQAFKKLNNKDVYLSDSDVMQINSQTINTNLVIVPAGSELVAKGKEFEVVEAAKEQVKKPGRPPKS